MDKKKLSIIAIVLGVLFVAALVLFAVEDRKYAKADSQMNSIVSEDAGYQELLQQYAPNIAVGLPVPEYVANYDVYQELMKGSLPVETSIINDQITFVGNEWDAIVGNAGAVKAVFTVGGVASGDATIGDVEYTYTLKAENKIELQEKQPVADVTVAEDTASADVTVTEDTASADVTAAEDTASVDVTVAEDTASADATAAEDAVSTEPVVPTYTYAIEDGIITLTLDGEDEVITLIKTEAAAE